VRQTVDNVVFVLVLIVKWASCLSLNSMVTTRNTRVEAVFTWDNLKM